MGVISYLVKRSNELHGAVGKLLNYDVCETIVKYEWYLYYDMDEEMVDYFIKWFETNMYHINKFNIDLTDIRNEIIMVNNTTYMVLTDEMIRGRAEENLQDRFEEELEDVSDYLRDYFDMDRAIEDAIDNDGYAEILGYEQLNDVNDEDEDYYICKYY